MAFLSHSFLPVVLILSYVTKKYLVACSEGWFLIAGNNPVFMFFYARLVRVKNVATKGGGLSQTVSASPDR